MDKRGFVYIKIKQRRNFYFCAGGAVMVKQWTEIETDFTGLKKILPVVSVGIVTILFFIWFWIWSAIELLYYIRFPDFPTSSDIQEFTGGTILGLLYSMFTIRFFVKSFFIFKQGSPVKDDIAGYIRSYKRLITGAIILHICFYILKYFPFDIFFYMNLVILAILRINAAIIYRQYKINRRNEKEEKILINKLRKEKKEKDFIDNLRK
jgi:hypothetical protein